MTAVALVCGQWISLILETYIDKIGGFLPYRNPEATFINISSGRQHKTCLPFRGWFPGFLVLSLCINSKMAITIFVVKARFLQRQKACSCGVLFAELWSTFSVETNLCKSALNFILVLERMTQERHIDQFLITWHFWPRITTNRKERKKERTRS